jgi:hypothetical protein
MATGRWHIELAEEVEPLSMVLWQPQPETPERDDPPPPPILPLLSALRHLAFRAGEPGAWGTPLADDPIAFLLDAIDEAVNVWTPDGRLVYSNRAATDLDLDSPAHPGVSSFVRGAKRFERRGLAFEAYTTNYVIEIVREMPRTG